MDYSIQSVLEVKNDMLRCRHAELKTRPVGSKTGVSKEDFWRRNNLILIQAVLGIVIAMT